MRIILGVAAGQREVWLQKLKYSSITALVISKKYHLEMISRNEGGGCCNDVAQSEENLTVNIHAG